MSVYVFVGPTLSADEARVELDAVYLPPVSQGDVYRVALRRPRAIGIIDGYFEHVPAVWHKEILWALSHGIHVYGAASMGALRAAELERFGMQGSGTIFTAFRDGKLEDDDEVAVRHGSADTGYLAMSEAMVNIRQTLRSAVATGVLQPDTGDALERIAKNLFYPDRAYPLILRTAAEQGFSSIELDAFRAWLPTGRIDQKREDALGMLRLMRQHLAADPPPLRVPYTFEHTEWWDRASRSAGELRMGAEEAQSVPLDALLDELRLAGIAYARARHGAMLRHLGLGEGQRRGIAVSAETLQRTTDEFRRAHGLFAPDDVERWLTENHLSREQFTRLMEEEALLRGVKSLIEPDVVRHIPHHVRLTGEYPELLARAQDKRRVLAAYGLDNPGLQDVGMTAGELVRHHFERIGQPVPADTDAYARAAGYADEGAFLRTLAREVCYRRLNGKDEESERRTADSA